MGYYFIPWIDYLFLVILPNHWTHGRFNVVTYRLHTFRCLGYPMLLYLHVLGQVGIVFHTHVVWSSEAERQASLVPLRCLVIFWLLKFNLVTYNVLDILLIGADYLLFTSQNGDSGSSGLLDVIRWIATRGPGESGELYLSPLKKFVLQTNLDLLCKYFEINLNIQR